MKAITKLFTGWLIGISLTFVAEAQTYNILDNLTISGGTITATTQFLGPNSVNCTIPGYAFTNSTSTGTARISNNILSLCANGTKTADITSTGIQTIDGTESLPSYTFQSDNASGMYRIGANQIGWTTTGQAKMQLAGTALGLRSDGLFYWNSGAINSGGDLFIARDAANTLAQRNSTNAQTFRIYNTFTDASNYERITLKWLTNNSYLINENAGTGLSTRSLHIWAGSGANGVYLGAGADYWQFNGASHFNPVNDASSDLGSSSLRPRDIYSSRQFLAGDGSVSTPSISFGSQTNTGLFINAANQLGISSNGVGVFGTNGTAQVLLPNTASIGWEPGALFGSPADVTLQRNATGILSIQNSTSATEFRVYGTTTGPKYLSLIHNGTDGVINAQAGVLGLAANGNGVQVLTTGALSGLTNGTSDLGTTTIGYKRLYVDYTNTGTVGAVTINKAAGRVNIAALGTSVVVTNSLVTAASHVLAVASTNDATAAVKNVVPAAGSFTINLTVAATAQTSFDFFVINAN